MNLQTFQQYVRILFYMLFSALTSNGITIGDGTKQAILGAVGLVATFIWTLYGTRLTALLEQVRAKTGVQSIEIKVDPDKIAPAAVTQTTSPGIVAKAA